MIHIIPLYEAPDGSTASFPVPSVRDLAQAEASVQRAIALFQRERGTNLRIRVYDDLADRCLAVVRPREAEHVE